MEGRITSNVSELVRRMNARRGAVVRELEAVAREFAPRFNAESKRIMAAKIYSVPIPLKAGANRTLSAKSKYRTQTTKGKYGKWRRAGSSGLLGAETARASGTDIIMTNGMRYARARFNLGLPGHRQPRTPGVQSVQWQTEAVEKLRPALLEARRAAVLRALRSP